MSSTSNDSDRDRERDALAAEMKRQMEQAKARGDSPEQMREQALAYAHEAARQRAPRTVARGRSCLAGLLNFLIIGAIALGLGIGLALFVERSYAAPLCQTYAAQRSLQYRGVDYPVIGNSSSTTSSGSCIFVDAAGQRSTVTLRNLEPNAAAALLASFGLQIDFTVPTFFVLVALVAVGLRHLRRSRSAP